MKTTTIYFVRHGEVKNPKKIIYGRLPNFGLSFRGRHQARKLRKYFQDKNVDIIYSSSLFRAKQTAEIIADSKNIIFDERLLEIDIKAWEGIKKNERPQKDLDIYVNHPEKFIGFGESVQEVVDRTNDFIKSILKKYPHKTLVVITHGEVIAAAQVIAGMIPFSEINKVEIRHASITRLNFEEKLKCKGAEYFTITSAKKDMI